MIPKIVVTPDKRADKNLEKTGLLLGKKVLTAGDEDMGVEDFRAWVGQTMRVMESSNEFAAVVRKADKLSWECQSVLLKPLEEMPENSVFVLLVESENGLVDTIRSRCELVDVEDEFGAEEKYWTEVTKCWKDGPAHCIKFSESLDAEAAEQMANEIIVKIRKSMESGVSEKRIEVLRLAEKLLTDISQGRLNTKLCVAEFLLSSWTATKT